MSTAFLILLLFLCVIIIIGLGSGFYLFKGKTEEITPTITVDDVSVESETPSGNTEMYTYDKLSKNIKINVTWSNGPDFDDVTNFYFTRTKGSVTDKKETDAQGRTSNSNGNKIVYIQKAGEDMRGQHTIKVTYKLRGQTQEKELTSFVANISEDQLTLTKDSLKPIPVTYSPATVPFSADVETKKTMVTLNPEPSGFGSLYFIPSGANNAIKIKRISDGKFLKHNASFQASGDTFYAQSDANNRNRISTTDTDEGKLLTAVGPTLKKYKDMNIKERTKSLFTFTFSPAATAGAAVDPDRACPRTVSAQRTDANGGWGMNLSFKCGDETAQIGNGTANKMTAGPLTLAAGACPETVDKTNWLGTDTYPDKFGITMSECIDPGETCPRTVSAQRTDANGGWGMNLRFKCGDETAEIGNGTANKMTTPTPININEISCPGTVSKANWLGTDTYPDKFAITVSDCQ
jgi:hypothetical protein